MKKTGFVLLFSLISWISMGQVNYHYAEANTAGTRGGGIVRTDKSSYVLTYREDGSGQGYFSCFSSTSISSFTEADLPSGWSVKDFQIEAGTVFFCGKDVAQGTALLGSFPLSDIITAGNTIHYSQVEILNNQSCYFAKMAVKKNYLGQMEMMLIGRMQYNVSAALHGSNMVAYIEDYFNLSPSNTSAYQLYPIPITTPADSAEIMWDVVVTDNFFATVGEHRFSIPNVLNVHIVPQGCSVSQFLTFFHDGYMFAEPGAWLAITRATELDQDNIAVAAMYVDETHLYGTTIYNIDLPSVQVVTNQFFDNYTKADVVDLTYLYGNNTLVLTELLYQSALTGKPGVIYLEPYTTSNYAAKEHYNSRPDISSVDNFSSTSYFGTNYDDVFYVNYPAGVTSSNTCINQTTRKVFQRTPPSFYSQYSNHNSLNLFTGVINMFTDTVNSRSILNSCLSQ